MAFWLIQEPPDPTRLTTEELVFHTTKHAERRRRLSLHLKRLLQAITDGDKRYIKNYLEFREMESRRVKSDKWPKLHDPLIKLYSEEKEAAKEVEELHETLISLIKKKDRKGLIKFLDDIENRE